MLNGFFTYVGLIMIMLVILVELNLRLKNHLSHHEVPRQNS